jgi:SAM-dependent methyltransferase
MITAADLLRQPETDPTSIYRYRDGLYAADFLTTALVHLDLFSFLNATPSTIEEICQLLKLYQRPCDVMLTLLSSMGFLEQENGRFRLTRLAQEHLIASSAWNIGPYFASLKERPVCLDVLRVLRTDKPANWGSLPNEQEWAKAMETEKFANQFTAAMDCRGIYLAPAMARRLECSGYHQLLDIAGGSGIYACSIVARHPHLLATVLERSPVDRLTSRCLAERGFADKISVKTADMFKDPFPGDCDIHLFSNVLHDWDFPRVRELLDKSYSALPAGGMLVIHDAHVNAEKTGPLPVAAYSALLMTITEGKCYSVGEMEQLLKEAGFADIKHEETAADRSIITCRKDAAAS